MIARYKSLSFNPIKMWVGVLIAIMLAGGIAGIAVFWKGLVITNLSDSVPWGLWITIDISAIALSAGAFLFCSAVYLLGLKQYRPMARTATFIGLIGYSMAMLCLLLDIGRPDRFWYGFVFWNTHSVLWEVTMCVGLYFIVLLLETMPILGRAALIKARWPVLAERITHVHHYAPYLAVAGLTLSLLHQSSLGATYGVIIARPIWYRPGLAVLFITSAIAGGLAITMLATILAARFSRDISIRDNLIERTAHFLGWVLAVYLYLRFWDVLAMSYTYQPGRNEGLSVLTSGSLSFNFWAGEMVLGIVIPMLILLSSRWRQQPLLRLLSLGLVVGGVVAYRWDNNLVGQMVVPIPILREGSIFYASYVPSMVEIVSGAGVIAFGLLAFMIGVKYLKVVNYDPPIRQA